MLKVSPLRIAALVALGARVAGIALGFASTVLIAHALPKDSLSLYWLALSVISFIVLISQSGIGQVTVARVSVLLALSKNVDAARLSRSSLLLVLATSASLASTAAVTSPWWPIARGHDLRKVIWFVWMGSVVCASYMQSLEILRGHHRLRLVATLSAQPLSGGLIVSGVFLLCIEAVIHTPGGLTLTYVYAALLIGWLVPLAGVLPYIWNLTSDHAHDQWRMAPLVKTTFLGAAPLVASGLTMFVITQADLWFTANYGSPSDTATYGLATNLVKYVSAANILIGALIPGVIADYYAKGELGSLSNFSRRMSAYGFTFALVIVAGFVTSGSWVIHLVAGIGYENALAPLVILSLGHLANAFFGYPQLILTAAGHMRVVLHSSLVAAIVTVLLLWFLTPHWNLVGAATASACGVTTYSMLMWRACRLRLGVSSHTSFLGALRPVKRS